jgi:hypothetical protein
MRNTAGSNFRFYMYVYIYMYGMNGGWCHGYPALNGRGGTTCRVAPRRRQLGLAVRETGVDEEPVAPGAGEVVHGCYHLVSEICMQLIDPVYVEINLGNIVWPSLRAGLG